MRFLRDLFAGEAQGWQTVEVEVEHYQNEGENFALVRDGKGYSALYSADEVPEGTYRMRKSDWAKVAFHEGGDRGAKAHSEGRKQGYRLRLDFSERD